MGETGEDDSSEDESETDSARRRGLMGMGLLCGTLLEELEDMLVGWARGRRAVREVQWEG